MPLQQLNRCSSMLTYWNLVLSYLMLWWLILCVVFTGPQDAQISDLLLFLGVSVRVFPKETISIGLSRLRNADCSPHCGWVTVNLWRDCIEKVKEKFFLSAWFIELGHQSSPALKLGSTPSALLHYELLTLVGTSPPVFPDLQLADNRSWNFFGSIIVWANCL